MNDSRTMKSLVALGIMIFSASASLSSEDPYGLEQEGDAAIAAHRVDKATIFYRQAMRERPDDFALLVKLAEAEHLLGRNSAALAILGRAVKLVPDDASAYVLMGRIYHAMKQHVDARIAYQKAVIIEPDNVAARLGLASAIQALGDHEGADDEMRRLRTMDAEGVR